jgi:DNA-directed RNA polymerase specialized sigma24 family protein
MDNHKKPHPDNELIKQLRLSPEPLDGIFRQHEDYCIRFMQNMKICDDDTINDIYTDSLLVLYENARKEEFVLTSSLQTYLNSICGNQVLVRFNYRKKIKIEELDTNNFDPTIDDWFNNSNSVKDQREIALKEALLELKSAKGNCYEILYRYFYLKQRQDQIAYEMGYTNADNIKNQKHRCQKRLKQKMLERLNK